MLLIETDVSIVSYKLKQNVSIADKLLIEAIGGLQVSYFRCIILDQTFSFSQKVLMFSNFSMKSYVVGTN